MTIVCVDNTPIMLQSLKENAQNAYPDADVQTFLTEEAALEYAEKFGCDVLLCEINPPRLGGLFLAEKIKTHNPKVNIIFVTVSRALAPTILAKSSINPPFVSLFSSANKVSSSKSSPLSSAEL